MPTRITSGFTLVELSIVLVILGLLVGGVLTGQSLIRAAELRSVSTQYQRYITAVQTFRDKYFAIPGDMSNAVAYWGAADGSTGQTAACLTTSSSDTKTCNGNADGQLYITSSSDEIFRFWQHLANAGLIEGTYTGVKTNASPVPVPAGKIRPAYWYVFNIGSMAPASMAMFNGNYGNFLYFGSMSLFPWTDGHALTPGEAYNIDTKLDDGKPATGVMVTRVFPAGCNDGTVSTDLSANYLLKSTAITCTPLFRNLF